MRDCRGHNVSSDGEKEERERDTMGQVEGQGSTRECERNTSTHGLHANEIRLTCLSW